MSPATNVAVAWPPEDRLAALVARTANGEAEALAALYDATVALIYGLAQRILADHGTAEEVTSDVYLHVWRQGARYDPARGTPLAWLLMLTRSRAIDRLRARAARRESAALEAAAALPSPAPGPHDDAVVAERRRIVVAALATLSPEQREAIEIAYYGGKSHSEIATALGLPLGTVKTRIRVGMTRLRDALAATFEESR